MTETLLERRVTLIPPGDPQYIPMWCACRSVPAFLRATDEAVALLQAGGPLSMRLSSIAVFRQRALDMMTDHEELKPYVDQVIDVLVLHFIETVIQSIYDAGRHPDIKAEAISSLRETVKTEIHWSNSLLEAVINVANDAIEVVEAASKPG